MRVSEYIESGPEHFISADKILSVPASAPYRRTMKRLAAAGKSAVILTRHDRSRTLVLPEIDEGVTLKHKPSARIAIGQALRGLRLNAIDENANMDSVRWTQVGSEFAVAPVLRRGRFVGLITTSESAYARLASPLTTYICDTRRHSYYPPDIPATCRYCGTPVKPMA